MSGQDFSYMERQTLAELLAQAQDRPGTGRGLTFVPTGAGDDDFVPYPTLARDARRFAAGCVSRGVEPGDRVALMIPDSRSFVTAFFGVLHAGGVPVPVYPPMRVDSLGEYLGQTRHIVESCQARLIITDAQVRRVLGSLVTRQRALVTVEALWEERDEAALVPRRMEDLAFLQYTSGSTSRPKGVQLTFANLGANMRCIAEGLRLEPDRDVGMSWLPLYHDMGLIGCVMTSMAVELALVVIPPLNFLKRPGDWLQRISDHGATLSFAPNFGYGLTTRRVRDAAIEGLKLSQWRVAGCGAEPIHRPTLEAFAARFAPAGFRAEALMPCYGLAESSLAVSFVALGTGVRGVHVSRQGLLEEGRAVPCEASDPDAVELVPCGKPFAGHGVRILGDDGAQVGDGVVGEIAIQGPSVTSGYYHAPEHDDELFKDGWLCTGDLGFFHEGELIICGRKKDLIIVHGRNHYASDIEDAMAGIPGVRPGQVAAFGLQQDDGEEVVVCAELRPEADEAATIHAIEAAIRERFGLKQIKVAVMARGAMPKTSSGKIRRHKARAHYLEGRLEGTRDNRLTTAGHLASSQIGLLRHHIAGFLGKLKPSPQPGR